MSIKHGVFGQVEPASILAAIPTASAIPFIVGTAPVHTLDAASVNTVEKVSTWAQFVAKFGYIHDFARYSLVEAAYAYFRVFGVGPLYLVNVFDPSAIAGNATSATLTLTDGVYSGAQVGKLVTKVTSDSQGETILVADEDYTLVYGDDGSITLTSLAGTPPTTLYLWSKAISASAAGAVAGDIVDGLDLLDGVFAQYGDTPSVILAPGWSSNATVAAAMQAKASYGGGWWAYPVHDIPANASTGFIDTADAADWKGDSGITGTQELLWPKCKVGTDILHYSVIFAARLARIDAEAGDIPYISGSNYTLPITGACLDDGTAVYLTDAVANADLNSFGITTAIRLGAAGWKTWGNFTAAYPGSSDPNEMWRNHRRMLVWLNNYARLNYMQQVDQPGNRRQIDAITNSLNLTLNGLSAQGALVGQPQVEFREEDNPLPSLLAGEYVFHVTVTQPIPMQAITFRWANDPSQLATLFTS